MKKVHLDHRQHGRIYFQLNLRGEVVVDASVKLGAVFENDGKRVVLTPDAPVNGVSWNDDLGGAGRMARGGKQ